MDKNDLINLVFASLPGVQMLKVTNSPRIIYITYGNKNFRLTTDLFVEECDGVFLTTSDDAYTIESTLKYNKNH
jgi:hypothetical protein